MGLFLTLIDFSLFSEAFSGCLAKYNLRPVNLRLNSLNGLNPALALLLYLSPLQRVLDAPLTAFAVSLCSWCLSGEAVVFPRQFSFWRLFIIRRQFTSHKFMKTFISP